MQQRRAGAPLGSVAPTRVLFVIYGLARAGPELRILDLARGFPDDIEVHVCVIGDDLTLLEDLRRTGAKVVIVPLRRSYAEWRKIWKIVGYIGQHGIQVVNSFNLQTLLVCAAAKLRYRSRVKLVHHLINLWEDVRPRQRAAVWAVMRCVDRVLCNGTVVREMVIGNRRLRMPVTVIPNGVDCDYFQSTAEMRSAERKRLGFTDCDVVFGTVANVRPVKNYPLLLRAMKRLSQTYPHVRLLCVGGGPQLEEMKALAHSLGLASTVQFTGVAHDVRRFLSAMDAFVLCSSKEGSPNVVLQAMAMSLPVVSAAVGEVPHLVQDGVSGLLFAPGNERELVSAAARVAGDEAYRRSLGRAGRERVQSTHSSSQMIAGYAALMREVVASG